MQTSRQGGLCKVILILGGGIQTVAPHSFPSSPIPETQPPLTSKIFLTEMESLGEDRGLYSPSVAHKFRTEVSIGYGAPLFSNAMFIVSFTAIWENGGPLRKLQARKEPRTLKSKLWPLDLDGSWSPFSHYQ